MEDSKLVYSTETGGLCRVCNRPLKKCVCIKKKRPSNNGDGVVRIRKEVAGRKGKTATVVYGFVMNDHELRGLAKELKTQCGTGGSVKNREKVMTELKNRGFVVKFAGG